MITRITCTVAIGSALLSLAGVAGAQEPEPSEPPTQEEPPQEEPPKEEETVEQKTIEVEPGQEVEVETRVRRQVTPPPPPAPLPPTPPGPPAPVEEPVVQGPPPPPVREAVIIYDGDDMGRPDLASRIGIGITAGGGVNDFTDDRVEEQTAIGGAWDVRLTIGTRSVIAGELAYVGSARDVGALGLDGSAYLSSHGAETAARINFLSGMVQPYILGGVGFTSYRVANADFNTSAIEDDDTVAHFPVGGGLGFRYEGFMLDGRGMFRPTVSDEMFGEDEAMHTWEAKLSGGVEF